MNNKLFTLDECKLIVSAVRNCAEIPERKKSELTAKLSTVLAKAFKPNTEDCDDE